VTVNKEQERRILSAEMSWLRRTAGIIRSEMRRNEEIRMQLQKEVTVRQNSAKRIKMIRTCRRDGQHKVTG